ncbi:CsbD family protein [Streptomyces sp. NPDC004232]|uniref:CsbD family protein n=1 Tax=unclassified Streptomyces TaxID=2593676 RepID=UPI001E12C7B5|nr:CsbD family protein [Streptomyces sp. tea 10]
MTAGEKAKALAEQAKGKVKKAMGHAVGSERVTAEGQAEKSTGHARQAKENIKDVFKR